MSPTGRLPGPYAEDACRFWNRDQYHLKLQKGSAELAHINVLHICDPNEEKQIERKSDKFLRKMGETHLSPRRKIESSSPRENRHQTRSQAGARSVRIRRTSGPRAKKNAVGGRELVGILEVGRLRSFPPAVLLLDLEAHLLGWSAPPPPPYHHRGGRLLEEVSTRLVVFFGP